jgi:prolyl 4-hydroxylase
MYILSSVCVRVVACGRSSTASRSERLSLFFLFCFSESFRGKKLPRFSSQFTRNSAKNRMRRTVSKSKALLATSVIGSSLLIIATFGILGPNIPALTTTRTSSLLHKNALREDYESRHLKGDNTRRYPTTTREIPTIIGDDDEEDYPEERDEDSMANLVPSLEKEEDDGETETDGIVEENVVVVPISSSSSSSSVVSKKEATSSTTTTTVASSDVETEEDAHPFARRKPRPPPQKFTVRDEAKQTPPEHVLDPSRMQIISLDHPRAFLYKRFMTDEECDYLIDHCKTHMTKSGVVDAETGGTAKSDIRTSTGSFVGIGANDLMKKLEKRVATFSMLPVNHQEATQVLRYEIKQEYRAHYDYFFHKGGTANNRIVTVLMYLHEPEFGGETVFPNTEVPLERTEKGWGKNFSECGNRGRAAVVKKGDALIFWSMKPGGELDPGSSHAGCPVVRGEKWTATKWIHVNPTNQWNAENHKVHYAGGPANSETCKDTNAACGGWAESGECTANPGFMVNSCKVSCRQCVGGWRDGSYDKPQLT